MKCDMCGKEIDDYKEGELRVCVVCIKAQLKKIKEGIKKVEN